MKDVDWKAAGKTLAKYGLPILGSALGPAGAGVGKIIGDMIGMEDPTPEKIIEYVESGKLTPEQMVLLKKYQMDHEENLIKLSQQSEERELQNILSAREAYKVHNTQADKLADNVMRYNLLIIAGLVMAEIFAVKYVADVAMLAVVCNLIGIVIQSLLAERQQVTGFFFGSSLGSKMKDQGKGK